VSPDLDSQVRLRAFEFLAEQTNLHGDVLPRDLLAAGFQFHDTRVPLLGPQGIFKPAILGLPISITTVPIVGGKDRRSTHREERHEEEWLASHHAE
jgi:hypothetical protein